MKLALLGEVTDMAIERARVLERIAEVESGRLSVAIGGVSMSGPGVDLVKAEALRVLKLDQARVESGLRELGVEIDDQTTRVPAVRVSGRELLGL